jgi:signal transduction histidine kinase
MLAVVAFVASLPTAWAQLHHLCAPDTACEPRLTGEGVGALGRLGLSLDSYATYFVALYAAFATACVAVATFIVCRRSAEPMALFGAFFLMLLGVNFPFTISELIASHPAWRLPEGFLALLSQAFTVLFCYTFPDGRLMPRWVLLPIVVWTVAVVPSAFFPGSPFSFGHMPGLINALLVLGCLGPIPVLQVYRYRNVSDSARRQQTKWVVFGLAVAFASLLGLSAVLTTPAASTAQHASPLLSMVFQSAYYVAMLLIPLSVGVAILRYRLWNIDVIINRTLVYGALTACILGIYVLVVGYVGALFHTETNLFISLLATGLVAALFAPLKDRLQRIVNRLMYGERDEPYAVLSRLGQRLKATDAPETALPAIVETAAQALKLPHAEIALKQDDGVFETVAVCGRARGEPLVLSLSYGTETIGQLILSPRAPGEPFVPADRRLLDDLARHAEAAAYAVRLTADLRRSRERLVAAREEERRRLRRDLHDGLGPQLATLTLKLDAARNLLGREPQVADALLAGLKAQVQAAISDIRRLVYALRPPALDELGLIPALREGATSHGQNGLNVSVEAPDGDGLPPLPAAVEVACYRIAQEAMTNVARHAGARNCLVRISLDAEAGVLDLEVTDDGIGLPEDRRAGVGLSSMRERAAELGGTCAAQSLGPAGGTRVLARLPLPASGEKP